MKNILSICFFTFCILGIATAQNGDPLPNVQVSDLSGKTGSILDFVSKDKITILDFWATWCHPCKQELDNIKPLYADWQKKYNVEIIAVSTDDARTFPRIATTVASKGWDYKILSDKNEDLKRALNFEVVPYTFIVKDGKVVYIHNGYKEGDENELEDQLKELTKK